MIKGLKEGLTSVASNLGIEKGASVVTNAVNVAKNGGRAYKKAMVSSGMGDRISGTLNNAADALGEAMKTPEFKALSPKEKKAFRDQHRVTKATASDLRGMESPKEIFNRIAEGRAMGRDIKSDGPVLSDYAVAGGLVAKDYLWDGATKAQRATRIGTVAAGYGVASGAARYVSGGSTMYNSKGERDIAGVPFM